MEPQTWAEDLGPSPQERPCRNFPGGGSTESSLPGRLWALPWACFVTYLLFNVRHPFTAIISSDHRLFLGGLHSRNHSPRETESESLRDLLSSDKSSKANRGPSQGLDLRGPHSFHKTTADRFCPLLCFCSHCKYQIMLHCLTQCMRFYMLITCPC